MNARTVSGAIIGLTLAIGAIAPAKAVTGCTNDLLTGTHALQLSGTITPALTGGVGGVPAAAQAAGAKTGAATAASGDAAGIARLVLDGAGGLFGNSAASIGGVWSEGPVTGSYGVGDDCTVALTLADSAGGTQHFNGVLGRFGDSAMLLQTDAGAGVSGALQRGANYCYPTDLAGSFQFRIAGAAIDSITSVGALDVDTDGNAAVAETRSTAGKSAQALSTGTASVNPDCTSSLALTSNADGSVTNYRGLLVNRKQLLLVRSDSGATISGAAAAQ